MRESNAGLDAQTAELNNGYLRVYAAAARPAGPNAALGTVTLLCELRFGSPAFGAAVALVATANALTQDSAADAAGVPLFARSYKSDGTTPVWDFSVGKTGGTEELLVSTTDGNGDPYIAAGSIVQGLSLTITRAVGT
jgi:hypothetical protein